MRAGYANIGMQVAASRTYRTVRHGIMHEMFYFSRCISFALIVEVPYFYRSSRIRSIVHQGKLTTVK
jgi:hypothetical protein